MAATEWGRVERVGGLAVQCCDVSEWVGCALMGRVWVVRRCASVERGVWSVPMCMYLRVSVHRHRVVSIGCAASHSLVRGTHRRPSQLPSRAVCAAPLHTQ